MISVSQALHQTSTLVPGTHCRLTTCCASNAPTKSSESFGFPTGEALAWSGRREVWKLIVQALLDPQQNLRLSFTASTHHRLDFVLQTAAKLLLRRRSGSEIRVSFKAVLCTNKPLSPKAFCEPKLVPS
ncbi:hypothetical protein PoB_005639300 [Plakobranchus ocellatus]|uniref:Uncharacterized protein n=1 Tax=Plakobranchus ocellatus TaxID=259542 RepID=A0AAV4CDB5_9GAST|nr:hypothetical protein PoB_005639300 [Plakobranchus ocellatus]